MKRIFVSIVAITLVCFGALAKQPKYVFYFIGDGMGLNHVYGTQLFNAAANGKSEPEELTFTQFPYRGFITTYCATSLVTDSAAAGTALATGSKTYSGSIGMDVNRQPLMSIARTIKEAGYGSGVVTSVGVNHATPAAFYGNVENRNFYTRIFDQLLEGRVDFAAGGDILVTNRKTETAQEQVEKARKAGWKVLLGDECKNATGDKDKTLCIGGELGHEELPYAIENKGVTLADLTRTAINTLSKHHRNGFFVMIEGGAIDHAAHGDDAASTFHEVNDMDRAIDVAMEFYRQYPDETLIFVTADHETGGLGLGAGQYELHLERLLYQNVSKGTLNNRLNALRGTDKLSWENAKEIISEATGLWTKVEVDPRSEAKFKETFQRTFLGTDNKKDVNMYASNEMLTKEVIDYLDLKACIFYDHTSHTGAQVPVFAIGAGAEQIAACRDNTDIPKTVLKLMLGK